jgi:hypothetical protein
MWILQSSHEYALENVRYDVYLVLGVLAGIQAGSLRPISILASFIVLNDFFFFPELAKDYLQSSANYEVVQGIISPASDAYPKSVDIFFVIVVAEISHRRHTLI